MQGRRCGVGRRRRNEFNIIQKERTMSRRWWLVLGTVTLAVGCATRGPAYFGGSKVGPHPCDDSGPCSVEVYPSCAGSACGGSLQYDPLNLVNRKGPVKITWTLQSDQTGTYVFCKQLGDGVFLKDEVSDQFKLETYTGTYACVDNVSIMAANTKQREKPYQYKIIFHKVKNAASTPIEVESTPYVIDPSMINQ
jgi:hypothetical protein